MKDLKQNLKMNNQDELKSLLLNYTHWLDRRGAFYEDLCIDWEHQIETFLELEEFYREKCCGSCNEKEVKHCQGILVRKWRERCKLFEKKIEEELKNE